MNKKALYESIMSAVTKQLSGVLNESSSASKLREVNSLLLGGYGVKVDDIKYQYGNNDRQGYYRFDMLTDDMIQIIENPTWDQILKSLSSKGKDICLYLCADKVYNFQAYTREVSLFVKNEDDSVKQ